MQTFLVLVVKIWQNYMTSNAWEICQYVEKAVNNNKGIKETTIAEIEILRPSESQANKMSLVD